MEKPLSGILQLPWQRERKGVNSTQVVKSATHNRHMSICPRCFSEITWLGLFNFQGTGSRAQSTVCLWEEPVRFRKPQRWWQHEQRRASAKNMVIGMEARKEEGQCDWRRVEGGTRGRRRQHPPWRVERPVLEPSHALEITASSYDLKCLWTELSN